MPPRPPGAPLLALLLLLAAGCVEVPEAAPAPIGDAAGAPLAYPVEVDHNHADPALHEAAWGLERVAYLSLAEADLPLGGLYNLATAGDLLVGSLGPPADAAALAAGMTLAVFDVADPAAPRLLATRAFPGGGVEAIALTDDAGFAFLGTEFGGAAGVWTVDLADPSRPTPVAFTPLPPEGPHNLRHARLGERHLVLASVAHVSSGPTEFLGFPQDSSPTHDLRVDVLEFDPARPERPLATLSSWSIDEEVEGTALVHDAVLQVHPVTGQPLMYVAYWDAGVRIVDLTDPANPVEVGKMDDFSPVDFGIVHTVKPHEGLLAGRHVTVATSQCAYAPDEPCHVRVLDTTDPARPTQVATWTLPEEVHGPAFTTEIFDLADGTLVVPWLHGGVWALDLREPAAPRATGYWLAHDPSARATGGYVPMANAAVLRDGHAFVADVNTGLHVLRLPR